MSQIRITMHAAINKAALLERFMQENFTIQIVIAIFDSQKEEQERKIGAMRDKRKEREPLQ